MGVKATTCCTICGRSFNSSEDRDLHEMSMHLADRIAKNNRGHTRETTNAPKNPK